MRPILQPCARAIPAFRRYLFRSAVTLSSPELDDSLHSHIATTRGDRSEGFIHPSAGAMEATGQPFRFFGSQKHHRNPKKFPTIFPSSQGRSLVSILSITVSEWMSAQKVCDLVPKDYADRLHLIENVLGLEAAEKFFQSIPENKRDDFVYTTILSSYTRSDQTRDKAEFIFWKMRELGYLTNPSAFNHMVSLYIQLDKRDMVEKILNQMEENNVKPNNLTFNLKLRRYAAVTNIKTMERLLKEHRIVSMMASAYCKRGQLRDAEKLIHNVMMRKYRKDNPIQMALLMRVFSGMGWETRILIGIGFG
ncbi:PREDICTED: putative pentatricopeptide repeat-containing protein At1g43010 [Camelina sativa]|uniref:Pentatricopeptide repeat-containing protein At1g43010 n=1 Tax=Camelina sativa TaxID=90675 RepID=A0ABM0YIX1_CAMSA|nr:PREDICTED: putative pentatricopeptide repeat-containing protein At1g43010 [Camelina sativa]